MTQPQTLSGRALHALSEMARFYRADQLTLGDRLDREVAHIKHYYSPADWVLEIWSLGRDGRSLIEDYADYAHSVVRTTGSPHDLDDEFTKIERMVDTISDIVYELGIAELVEELQRNLTARAEAGSFRYDEMVYLLEGSIHNPSMANSDERNLRQVIETRVLRALKWPEGFAPRHFVLVSVKQYDFQGRVAVTVKVGKKTKG